MVTADGQAQAPALPGQGGRAGETPVRQPKSPAAFGIAHTRWATHGRPSEQNAHPHLDCPGKIGVVHNGIIENYQELKEELLAEGTRSSPRPIPRSIAHLIEMYYEGRPGDGRAEGGQAPGRHLRHRGHHARRHDGLASSSPSAAARSSSASGDKENFAASDANALLPHTNRLIYLNDDEMAVLAATATTIKNLNNEILQKEVELSEPRLRRSTRRATTISCSRRSSNSPKASRTPSAAASWKRGRIQAGRPGAGAGRLKNIRKLIIVSCGTSYYAGLLGRYIFEHLTRAERRSRNGLGVPLPQAEAGRQTRRCWPYRNPARPPTPWPRSARPSARGR